MWPYVNPACICKNCAGDNPACGNCHPVTPQQTIGRACARCKTVLHSDESKCWRGCDAGLVDVVAPIAAESNIGSDTIDGVTRSIYPSLNSNIGFPSEGGDLPLAGGSGTDVAGGSVQIGRSVSINGAKPIPVKWGSHRGDCSDMACIGGAHCK